MSFRRLISKVGFPWKTGFSTTQDRSGGHSHRRRRLQIPGARPPVSKAEKTLLFLLVLLLVAVLVRISMQERPPGVEIVSPKEATFTPPR